MPIESKAAFGRRQGISKQRVGQLVIEGKIDGAALVEQAGKTLINSDVAEQQLRRRLDPGQRLGQKHSIARQPRRSAAARVEIQLSSLDIAIAMLLEIPADTAWDAISHGVEPWRAWALSEAARQNLVFELRERLGIDADVPFDAIPWPAIFTEYGVKAPVNVKAWAAAKARHDKAWQAAEAAEREAD